MAFKARKLSDSIMESQDSFIMREFEDAEVYFGDDFEEIVVGCPSQIFKFRVRS